MARPLTNSIPPPPPDYRPCGIPAIDSFFFGRWPHLFTLLAREYNVPRDFLVVLLHLWEATVGCKQGPECGYLALSQVTNVPPRLRDKWLAALVASGFFTVETAGPHDREGSRYIYNEEASPEEWESFFHMAEWLNRLPHWDKVKESKKFGRLFKPEMLQQVRDGAKWLLFKPGEDSEIPQPLTGDEREKNTKKIKTLFAEARARKEEQ
jgi:hypothetical protein